jgi:hypothetical protein
MISICKFFALLSSLCNIPYHSLDISGYAFLVSTWFQVENATLLWNSPCEPQEHLPSIVRTLYVASLFGSGLGYNTVSFMP